VRVLAQARKELTQFLRDRLALTLALLLPVLLMLLMGSAISLTPTDMPIGVRDYDNSEESRSLVEALNASLVFRVVDVPLDWSPERAFEAKAARALVVIPEHFSRDLLRGNGAEVQAIVDATDTNTATQIRGYFGQVVGAFVAQRNGARRQDPVQLEIRLWYNPGRESRKFFGPGAFVFVLSIFPPLLAALAMSKENELNTITQVYVSSITAAEYLLGKISAYMVITSAAWVISLTVAVFAFGLRFAGDPTPFLAGSLFYVFTSVSFGVMVGAAMPSQAVAVQAVAIGGFLSSFLLSGLIFPVQNIPEALRWVSYLVQARYFIEVSRDAFLQGGGWPAMSVPVLMIAVLGMFYFLVAWWNLRQMQVKA
jgi:ABC-type multidrug transport system, permease component